MFAQSLSLLVIFLTIIAGIFFNNKGLTDLKADIKADMKDLKAELKGEMTVLRTELKSDLAGLETRIEKRLDRIDTRLNAIQSEQLHFSELKGHLEGRVNEIAKLVAERLAA